MHLIRNIFPLLLCYCAVSAINAQKFTLLTADVSFSIRNAGIMTKGRFTALPEILMAMPGNDPNQLKLEGKIAAATVNTGISLRDEHLRGSGYFDTNRYPFMVLESTGIARKGNTIQGNFILQIKNQRRPVVMDITISESGNQVTLTGAFSINRRSFGVGGKSLLLSDEVQVIITGVFRRSQ